MVMASRMSEANGDQRLRCRYQGIRDAESGEEAGRGANQRRRATRVVLLTHTTLNLTDIYRY